VQERKEFSMTERDLVFTTTIKARHWFACRMRVCASSRPVDQPLLCERSACCCVLASTAAQLLWQQVG